MFPKATILVALLLYTFAELDARQHDHHGGKRGKNHQHHGHHRNTWDGAESASSDKHEVHVKKISWLNVQEVTGCHCKHGEICIEGPDNRQPICVKEHELRESARLFKNYHEMKEAAQRTGLEKSEETLNEVDPKHGAGVQADAPHDIHINVTASHTQHHPKHDGQHAHRTHSNIVLNNTPYKLDNTLVTEKHCDNADLDQMRQRLTGWFHLLHGKDHHPHHGHKKHRHLSVKKELNDGSKGECDCLKSVMWEFRQLDADNNHKLNSTEIKVIDNNDREPCLHPYLGSCDKNRDDFLSRHEWCCCFPEHDSESPCYAKLKEIESSHQKDGFVPRCDREGYYEKEQCFSTGLNTQTCWCVTPNGSEISGTRTVGRAHCRKLDHKNML